MGITDYQQTLRAHSLGSSDMAAVMGMNPYCTAYDVWLQKTGQLEPQPANASMEAGTMFEQGILNWATGQLGPLIRNQRRVCPDAPLASNIDAIVASDRLPVEAKTAGLFGPLTGTWGDYGTDEVPESYIIQCHVHMICGGADFCHLAAFLGGRGFVLYGIHRNEVVANAIKDAANSFWDRNVIPKIPPEDSQPSMAVIKRIRREPESVVDVPPVLVDTYNELRKMRLEAAKREDRAKAELLAALGNAEAGRYDGGMVTFMEYNRKGYTVEASKYRQLKIKAAKEK